MLTPVTLPGSVEPAHLSEPAHSVHPCPAHASHMLGGRVAPRLTAFIINYLILTICVRYYQVLSSLGLCVVRFFNWWCNIRQTTTNEVSRGWPRLVSSLVLVQREGRRSEAAAASPSRVCRIYLIDDVSRNAATNIYAAATTTRRAPLARTSQQDFTRSILFEGFIKADLFRDLFASLCARLVFIILIRYLSVVRDH